MNKLGEIFSTFNPVLLPHKRKKGRFEIGKVWDSQVTMRLRGRGDTRRGKSKNKKARWTDALSGKGFGSTVLFKGKKHWG